MEKRFVFRFSFFDLKNENEKTNRFSFILLNFFHVKCNCGIVHGPKSLYSMKSRYNNIELEHISIQFFAFLVNRTMYLRI